MGALERFERRVEGLVSGAFARAFKSEVQPVEIASALQRECDDRAAIVSKGRTMVPNEFLVELGATDHERLSPYLETLGDELASVVREHAAEQRYSLIGPVEVRFERVDDLDTGMLRVRSRARAGVTPAYADDTGVARSVGATAWLEINGRRHYLTQPVTTIGRGTASDLRVDDPGISRRHAQIRLDPTPMITDLGSTNGTVVDGGRVDHSFLDDGAVIRLGSTTLIFRRRTAAEG